MFKVDHTNSNVVTYIACMCIYLSIFILRENRYMHLYSHPYVLLYSQISDS